MQSFVDLARLAKDDGDLILHWTSDGTHQYALETDGRLYFYACEPPTTKPPARTAAEEPTS